MCRRIECACCGRPSVAGCGAHVEQVLGDVPAAERCTCGPEDPPPASLWPWLSGLLTPKASTTRPRRKA